MAALTRLHSSCAQELYDSLRAAYNSCGPPRGSLPVPPLEEWQGVSMICEQPTCRCVKVFRSLRMLPCTRRSRMAAEQGARRVIRGSAAAADSQNLGFSVFVGGSERFWAWTTCGVLAAKDVILSTSRQLCAGCPCCHPLLSNRLSFRAAERLFASKHMRAFSIVSDDIQPAEGGWDKLEKFLDPGGQREAQVLAAAFVADGDSYFAAPFVPGNRETWSDPSMSTTREAAQPPSQTVHEGAGSCIKPAQALITSAASSASLLHHNCSPSETDLSTEEDFCRLADMAHGGMATSCGVDEGVAHSPETMTPQVVGEGGIEEAEDDDVGAADWLDVMHALSDAA